jgi:short-subunit dehydrogenase
MSELKKTIVVLGATSAIAHDLCKLHGQAGDHIILVGRNANAISSVSDDISSRSEAEVDQLICDFSKPDSYADITTQVSKISPTVDIWYVFYGTLPEQSDCEQSVEKTRVALQVNFTSVVDILTEVANDLEKKENGSIVVVSSVAGDRGRLSNYVYGAAKGALTLYLQGLRNRLHKSGVHVMTVKPGFVATPMTAHLNQNGLLWATPDKVAALIYKGVERKKDVIYTPWFWRPIMMIIKFIPEPIFKRLKL